MKFEDHGDKTSARQPEEVKASLKTLALLGLIDLVHGVVPHFPVSILALSVQGEIDHDYVPLYDGTQLLWVCRIVGYAPYAGHGCVSMRGARNLTCRRVL